MDVSRLRTSKASNPDDTRLQFNCSNAANQSQFDRFRSAINSRSIGLNIDENRCPILDVYLKAVLGKFLRLEVQPVLPL